MVHVYVNISCKIKTFQFERGDIAYEADKVYTKCEVDKVYTKCEADKVYTKFNNP